LTDDMGTPVTLGDKLKSRKPIALAKFGLVFLVAAIIGLLSWWLLQNPLAGISAFTLCSLILGIVLFKNRQNTHFLLYADREGFMKSLKLADKTAIFDGSNIYHFGLDHRVGTRALKILVQKLRGDGYRVVCFFDANIYFRLRENGEFLRGAPFTIQILQTAFDLNPHEIYVVPSKIQADRFIVETLSHLPISFAVTNDRFGDYAAEYNFLAKDNEWRKGARIEGGELLLNQYSFKEQLTL